jgi:hypothetical protein
MGTFSPFLVAWVNTSGNSSHRLDDTVIPSPNVKGLLCKIIVQCNPAKTYHEKSHTPTSFES